MNSLIIILFTPSALAIAFMAFMHLRSALSSKSNL